MAISKHTQWVLRWSWSVMPQLVWLKLAAMQILDLVELTAIKHNIVGTDSQTGLSVEQRKRLTIAVELVANPSIVFMDEPTSGATFGELCCNLTCNSGAEQVQSCLQQALLRCKHMQVCPCLCAWCAGLDARAAAVVMRAVRNINDTGRTIACTIHQPSIGEQLALCSLLLLADSWDADAGCACRHL